jgi:hypothetical protein
MFRFSNPTTKRTKPTLSEYFVDKLGISDKTKTCEELLTEYMKDYFVEQPKTDFVNKLLGWFEAQVVKQQEHPSETTVIIEIFGSKDGNGTHKELLYLLYTFLEQFNDPATYDKKMKAMNQILEILRTSHTDTGKMYINTLLQAIIHTSLVEQQVSRLEQEVGTILNQAVGKGEEDLRTRIQNAAVEFTDATGRVLNKAATQASMVSVQSSINTIMLSINTVYQSLLFQVMTVLKEETKSTSTTSCQKYDTDIFET